MSSYIHIFYEDGGVRYSTEHNPVPFLRQKLFAYRKEIGISGYTADDLNPEETVKWIINDIQYSTKEVENLIKLKAFL